MLKFSILNMVILIVAISLIPLIHGQQDGFTEIQNCSNNSILSNSLTLKQIKL